MNNIIKTANTPSYQRNGEVLESNPLHFTSTGRNFNNIFQTDADEAQPIWTSPTSGHARLNTAKSDAGKRGFLAAAKFDARYQTRARQRYNIQ